jgi:hypothetical protein
VSAATRIHEAAKALEGSLSGACLYSFTDWLLRIGWPHLIAVAGYDAEAATLRALPRFERGVSTDEHYSAIEHVAEELADLIGSHDASEGQVVRLADCVSDALAAASSGTAKECREALADFVETSIDLLDACDDDGESLAALLDKLVEDTAVTPP